MLRKNPAVVYNPSKFEFIGGIANSGTIVVINRAALPRLHDPSAPAVAMAQVGGTRPAAQTALWGAEYLGWNVKWVSGYEGNAEFTLALLRGEADMIDTASAEILQQLLGDSRFEAVVQTGVYKDSQMHRRDFAPDVDLLSDLLAPRISGAAQAAFESWLRTTRLGKFFALPEHTPPAAVAAFQAAFTAMQKDPDFIALAHHDIDPDYVLMTAEETKTQIEDLAATPDARSRFPAPAARKIWSRGSVKAGKEE